MCKVHNALKLLLLANTRQFYLTWKGIARDIPHCPRLLLSTVLACCAHQHDGGTLLSSSAVLSILCLGQMAQSLLALSILCLGQMAQSLLATLCCPCSQPSPVLTPTMSFSLDIISALWVGF